MLESLLREAPKSFHRSVNGIIMCYKRYFFSHRMLYEQKIQFKSKLGRNIDGEMIRFQVNSCTASVFIIIVAVLTG